MLLHPDLVPDVCEDFLARLIRHHDLVLDPGGRARVRIEILQVLAGYAGRERDADQRARNALRQGSSERWSPERRVDFLRALADAGVERFEVALGQILGVLRDRENVRALFAADKDLRQTLLASLVSHRWSWFGQPWPNTKSGGDPPPGIPGGGSTPAEPAAQPRPPRPPDPGRSEPDDGFDVD